MRKLIGLCGILIAGCNAQSGLTAPRGDSGGRWELPPPRPSSLDGGIAVFGFDGGTSVAQVFGPMVETSPPPPPITGGNVLLLRGDRRAAIADQDRDRVIVADLERPSVEKTFVLTTGDRPGRLAEGADGRLHVVLQGAGSIATLEGDAVTRTSICAAPRGIAYDAAARKLHVACASGELITLDEASRGGRTVRWLEDDLRDVVVEEQTLWVSRFRSADVLEVRGDANPVRHRASSGLVLTQHGPTRFAANTAWRMVANPTGGVLVVHQRSTLDPVQVDVPSAYGGRDPCGSPLLHSAVSWMRAGRTPVGTGPIAQAVLAVDLAVSRDGGRVSVAVPGVTGIGSTWLEVPLGRLAITAGPGRDAGVTTIPDEEVLECYGAIDGGASEEVVGVAYDARGNVLAYAREPAALLVGHVGAVSLGGPSRAHLGHAMFHRNPGAQVACASCHAEGGDDGRVWDFAGLGPRRTQSIRGGLSGTEPFHWDGELRDLRALLGEVMVRRMGGPTANERELAVFARWIDSIPELPNAAPVDATLVARGRALFEDASVGCATCHNGARFTNNTTVNVGTGGVFQVPSLRGIAHRAPYLHDGCANDLFERFGACGGGDRHGHTSQLSSADITALVVYLETL